mmetsp:Transcript_389/g.1484  ORF Transcript_389/g.1484 Transcript_389/m.1484 type:complete len:90 (+) Transcript_389:473-742(+)
MIGSFWSLRRDLDYFNIPKVPTNPLIRTFTILLHHANTTPFHLFSSFLFVALSNFNHFPKPIFSVSSNISQNVFRCRNCHQFNLQETHL